MKLLPKCLCGVDGAFLATHLNIPILRCMNCGIVRQDVEMTEAELAKWYAEKYYEGVYTHTKQHDLRVAERRVSAYNLPSGSQILDVGCGNGAFVEGARSRGYNAWGQDMAQQAESDYVFVGSLTDVAFPTAEFDAVTVHDVLEHVPEPKAFLLELKRVLKPGGLLIVDFPRFWHESGTHHWKLIEHLWMLTGNELMGLLQECGFDVESANNPIPSKIVIRSRAPAVQRTTILVPAGIGDAYWVMTKIRGFLKEKGITIPPNIVVQDAGGPKRTHPFLRTVPFVHAGGYMLLRTRHHIWKEAYLQDGRTVFEKPFPDIDWFIAYNGVMRYGKALEQVDPQWPVEWHFNQHIPKSSRAFQKACQADGPYCVVYITDGGMYQDWLAAFPPERITEALKLIQQRYGFRMIFIGAEWDKEMTGERLAQYGDDSWIDLVGETSYEEMVGVLRGASLVVGYPAGNTILATAWKIPTVLLWHGYFDFRFWKNACPPVGNYAALNTQALTTDVMLDAVDRVLKAQP